MTLIALILVLWLAEHHIADIARIRTGWLRAALAGPAIAGRYMMRLVMYVPNAWWGLLTWDYILSAAYWQAPIAVWHAIIDGEFVND